MRAVQLARIFGCRPFDFGFKEGFYSVLASLWAWNVWRGLECLEGHGEGALELMNLTALGSSQEMTRIKVWQFINVTMSWHVHIDLGCIIL